MVRISTVNTGLLQTLSGGAKTYGYPKWGTTSLVKPTAANTGCRIAKASLTTISAATINNSLKGSNPTLNWSGYYIQGPVSVQCRNATFTDCIFEATSAGSADGFLLQSIISGVEWTGLKINYCTFNGLGTTSAAPLFAVQLTEDCLLNRCNISGCQDGVRVGTSGAITENYIHGNIVPAGSHADGIQSINPINGFLIAGNNIDVSDATGSVNAAIQFGSYGVGQKVSNLTIQNNWINGGGYSVSGGFIDGTNSLVVTNCRVVNNRFGLTFAYASPLYPSGPNPIGPYFSGNTSNVWDVTGVSTGTGRSVTAGAAVT